MTIKELEILENFIKQDCKFEDGTYGFINFPFWVLLKPRLLRFLKRKFQKTQ